MSKSQVAIPENKTVALGEGNREEEIEETEETTLSERHKDLGHTKISEKKATFDSTINKSIVEDNRSQQVHSTKNVMQSENVEVSENKKFNPGDSAKAISTEVSQTPLSNLGYGALEPLKSFEPLKPFAPLEFDVPTSFELVKNTNTLLQEDKDKYAETQKKLVIPEVRIDSPKEQFSVETNDRVPESNLNIFAELGYVPVQPLAPLDINTLFSPVESQQNTNKIDSEIKDGNIRNSLKEIISDLDNYVEKSESLVRGVDEGYSRLRNERDENAPPKPVNLEKIFTPADGEQIKPTKSRKVFASSAFYEKGFHPTVEDQIKLAHRISSSLSDISNKSSKGQSMYVKRMKRSVKWVHEGEGRGGYNAQELLSNGSEKPKDPLKLVMNPHGQVHDINSLRKQGFNVESALSPEIAQEIVRGLNSPKGKGAELFAKRRKRSEKWVVGETNGTRQTPLVPEIPPTPVPQISLVQPPANTNLPPPSYLPETVERLQHKQKLDDIQNKFNRPRVKLIKSPWDAALETGSVDAAFVEEPTWPTKGNYVAPAVSSYETALKSDNLTNWSIPKNNEQKMYSHNANYNSSSINKIIDSYQKGVSNVDVYKPTMPQGWATHKQFGSHRYCQVSTRKIQKKTISKNPPTAENPNYYESPDLLSEPKQTEPKIIETPDLKTPVQQEEVVNPLPMLNGTVETKCTDEITIEANLLNNETVQQSFNEKSENCNNNYPYKIPNIFSYLDKSNDSISYRPTSPKATTPTSEFPSKNMEFNFALPDLTSRVVENSFINTTRTIQSEIFESQGHFNASRSCSPYPIYVPKYEYPHEPSVSESSQTADDEHSSKLIIEPLKHKDPKYEEHVKNFAIKTDRGKEGMILLQKGCFNEFKEKKMNKNQKTIDEFVGTIQIQTGDDDVKHVKEEQPQSSTLSLGNNTGEEMRNQLVQSFDDPISSMEISNEIILGQTELNQQNNDSANKKQELTTTANESDKTLLNTTETSSNILKQENIITTETLPISTKESEQNKLDRIGKQSDRKFSPPEQRKFRKAPETIIGAKPVFGQLDINSEFQKAIMGRQQAIQAKRLKQSSGIVTRSNDKDPCVKIENAETEVHEEIGQNSKLSTEVKRTEIAEVEMIYPSEHEEIEKINYAQEREVHIDFQKIGDEIVFPCDFSIQPQAFSSFQEFIQNQHQSDSSIETDQEEYRKIPVRSLIQSFEQSVKPHLKYKQLREDLPNVVEKLLPTQPHKDMVETSREMSATTYHVANVEVISQYFPPDQSRMQIIEPSENSSFCKYSSLESTTNEDSAAAGSNTLPRTKSKSYEDSYYKSPTPIIKETAAEEAVYSNYQSEPNYEPSLLIRETPKQFKKLDLSNCQNYNVAPRAWNEAKNCYKPIGTSQPREMYSDF